jgi:hypothetical protein
VSEFVNIQFRAHVLALSAVLLPHHCCYSQPRFTIWYCYVVLLPLFLQEKAPSQQVGEFLDVRLHAVCTYADSAASQQNRTENAPTDEEPFINVMARGRLERNFQSSGSLTTSAEPTDRQRADEGEGTWCTIKVRSHLNLSLSTDSDPGLRPSEGNQLFKTGPARVDDSSASLLSTANAATDELFVSRFRGEGSGVLDSKQVRPQLYISMLVSE